MEKGIVLMKIFFLPTSYPNKKNPQKAIFVYEQAKQLAQMGHEITVLHVEKFPTRDIFRKINRKIEVIDDKFTMRFTIQQKTFFEEKFPELNKHIFLKNVQKLFDFALEEKGKPDVIYAHFSKWAGYAGGQISKKYGIPLVTMEHFGGLVRGNISNSLRMCVKETIKNSKYFICVSESLKNSIEKQICSEKEIYVIPNMIDNIFGYKPVTSHKGFIFCAIGRLNESKNYQMLIHSFINAFGANEKIYLRIGGDGEERRKLEKIVNDSKRQHQIKFLGALTREQTLTEYINCDSFALSSSWETYGIVYREALAVGRPIVTTNHGGFSKEDWHSEYGYMVPVKDIEAFSEALKFMVKNYNSFEGRKISEICLKDCASDMVCKKIESFLLMAKRN